MRQSQRGLSLAIVAIGLLVVTGSCAGPSVSSTTVSRGGAPTNVTPNAPGLSGSPALPRGFVLPIPLFAPNSAWNQIATAAAALPESDQQVLVTYRVLRGDTTSLHPPGPPPTTWPFMDVNYSPYAIPVFRAGAGQQSVRICDYEGNLGWPHPKFGIDQEGGPVTVPVERGCPP